MAKKLIVSLIILLAGTLSLLIYSANNEGKAARFVREEITAERKAADVPAKNSSDSMQTSSGLITEIKEIVPDREEIEKPPADTFSKKEPAARTAGRLEAAPAVEEIIQKREQPVTLTAAASLIEIKRKEDVGTAGIEEGLPAAKKELIITEETSGRSEKLKAVVPFVEEKIKSPDKPDNIKEERRAAIPGEETKPPIAKIVSAEEAPRIAEQNKETMPAGGLFIMPAETPMPDLIELSFAGAKNSISDETIKQPSAKMDTSVAAGQPGKAMETGQLIPPPGKTEGYMKKPEPSQWQMLIKGKNKRIAIFPFENLSDDRDAFRHVLPLLIDKLERRGFEVVDEDELNNFLCKERVRYAGYIPGELSGKIRKEFNVSTILTGAIISFSTEEIPAFGILARMIDTSDGTILWADYSTATGEDFIAILELGRLKTVFSLIPKVMDILFASFKDEGLNREIKPLPRIAVMPFKNNTDFNNAGIIVTYMFITEIFKSQKFIPIEYGDTRDIIIKLGIRRKGDIGYENIGELSKELKVRGIIVGVVENYSDGAAGSTAPNVGITARLVDGSNKKILWYNSFQLSGEENIIALDWGRIRSVHSVAYKAISGLVKEMSRKKWPE